MQRFYPFLFVFLWSTGFVGVALVVSGKLGGTLYQKLFCARFDLRTGSVIQFVPSAVLTAVAVAWLEEFRIEWTPQFTFALAWLVLVLSIGAIGLLNLLIRNGSAVNVAKPK